MNRKIHKFKNGYNSIYLFQRINQKQNVNFFWDDL